ncbi:coenzyme PQQ synthesis protein E [Geobacter sp. OR-1]|uniref:radical SAM protein n=1 Tax=Geobacter sp. OR-1 TaxID=1266765 RepID=UPI000541ECD3|nr:radical SAM protein [Geobacter sp. OR-1]GAM10566.1 coenzyme PQQ synthesis protein E [Geobacter sp. OR-1]
MIRKVYSNLAQKILKQKKLSLLARFGGQYLLINASRMVGKPLCGPVFGILILTYRCNLQCSYCDMPETARLCSGKSMPELDTAGFKRVIDDFATLGVKAIAFTGGEPLLRQDIPELIAYAHQRGIMGHLSTNGMLINAGNAAALLQTGLESISISLDGSTADVHQLTRRAKGAYDRALAALRTLVSVRNSLKAPVRIKILTVVNKHNIDDIRNILELAAREGIDGVELMPCQPLLSGGHGEEFTYDDDFVGKVDRTVAELVANRRLRSMIDNSSLHLDSFKNSFSGQPSTFPCYAGFASIVVDCYGDLYPCHPWANWRNMSLNIADKGLVKIWNSPEYQKYRDQTVQCGKCYLNCQTELSIMLGLVRSSVRNRLTNAGS